MNLLYKVNAKLFVSILYNKGYIDENKYNLLKQELNCLHVNDKYYVNLVTAYKVKYCDFPGHLREDVEFIERVSQNNPAILKEILNSNIHLLYEVIKMMPEKKIIKILKSDNNNLNNAEIKAILDAKGIKYSEKEVKTKFDGKRFMHKKLYSTTQIIEF